MNRLDEMYRIRQIGARWEVYNPANGHIFGAHPSREKALAQQRALYKFAPPEKEGKMAKEDDWDDLHEAGYDASASDENFAYVPKDAPPSGRKLKIGDAEHTWRAVQAVADWRYRGQALDIPKSAKPGIVRKVGAAVRKFFKGKEQKYYLSWLHTGKKPDKKPLDEMYIPTPRFTAADMAGFPPVTVDPDLRQRLVEMFKDADPLFVTRPLAVLDGVSENGLRYDEQMLDDILNQVNAKHPAARRGHVSEADRGSAFPPDEGWWIGAVRGTFHDRPAVFGKCYLSPTQPLHEMVKAREVTGTPISNSIWGGADRVGNPDGTWHSLETEIETIDFVPEERAALRELGGEFKVTSEMEDGMAGHDDEAQDRALFKQLMAQYSAKEIHEALREAGRAHEVAGLHLKECEPGMAREMLSAVQRRQVAEGYFREEEASPQETYGMLKEEARKHIMEAFAKEKGFRLSREEEEEATRKAREEEEARVRESVSEMGNLRTQVAKMGKSMRAMLDEKRERAFADAVENHFQAIHLPPNSPKESLLAQHKKNFRTLIVAEMAASGQTEQERIPAVAAKVWTDYEPIAKQMLAEMMGPPAFVQAHDGGGPNRYGFDPQTGLYSDEKIAEVKRNLGLGGSRLGYAPRKEGDQ